jgi:hypothetical protein
MPAMRTRLGLASAAAMPTIKLAVETMPSLAPRTAALNQPMRCDEMALRVLLVWSAHAVVLELADGRMC